MGTHTRITHHWNSLYISLPKYIPGPVCRVAMAIHILPWALVALIYGDVQDTRRCMSANQIGCAYLC